MSKAWPANFVPQQSGNEEAFLQRVNPIRRGHGRSSVNSIAVARAVPSAQPAIDAIGRVRATNVIAAAAEDMVDRVLGSLSHFGTALGS
ncbi:hypothetical protein VCV18_004346 [Metarhizium anisopliae]